MPLASTFLKWKQSYHFAIEQENLTAHPQRVDGAGWEGEPAKQQATFSLGNGVDSWAR